MRRFGLSMRRARVRPVRVRGSWAPRCDARRAVAASTAPSGSAADGVDARRVDRHPPDVPKERGGGRRPAARSTPRSWSSSGSRPSVVASDCARCAVAGGAAFGAYDLHPVGGAVSIDLVVVSDSTRSLARRSSSNRWPLGRVDASRSAVSRAGRSPGRAPCVAWRRDAPSADETWPSHAPSGRRSVRRVASVPPAGSARHLDVDRDGCADIVDIQALLSAQRSRVGWEPPTAVRPARRHAAGPGIRRLPGHIHRGQRGRHRSTPTRATASVPTPTASAPCVPRSPKRSCSQATSPSISTCRAPRP